MTKQRKTILRKTGIPLTELNRNIGETPKAKPSVWIPAEQAAMLSLLQEILETLKQIEGKL